MSRSAKVLLLLFAAFVLLPVPYNVVLGKPPWLPVSVNEFWRFTDLFSHRPSVWPSYHLLFQSTDGSWRELPRELVYRDSLFGGMTRLDMTLLNFSPRKTDPADVLSRKRRVLDRVCLDFLTAYSRARERTESLAGIPPDPDMRLVIGWTTIARGMPERRWSARLVEGQKFDVVYECRQAR